MHGLLSSAGELEEMHDAELRPFDFAGSLADRIAAVFSRVLSVASSFQSMFISSCRNILLLSNNGDSGSKCNSCSNAIYGALLDGHHWKMPMQNASGSDRMPAFNLVGRPNGCFIVDRSIRSLPLAVLHLVTKCRPRLQVLT